MREVRILVLSLLFISAVTSNINNEVNFRSFKDIKPNPDAGLDIYKYLKKYGYPVETHTVQTEDGYILRMQRIPYGKNGTDPHKFQHRPAVLLMHGLFCSAMDFVNTGPGKALALVLADAGYDVWLGNNRGNTWSRNHVKLNPDIDHEFWEYSFETLGRYDVPAKIDYILEKTDHTKILYIGHSQGTAQFFAMAALRPEYNEKIALMSALAPVAYVSHSASPLFSLLQGNMDKIEPFLKKLGWYELSPHSDILAGLLSWLTSDGAPLQEVVAVFIFLICGFDNAQLDRSILPVMVTNTPAGISLQMLVHFAQMQKSGKFQRFDYGEEKNKGIYGSVSPPEFNVAAITAPVALYYAQNDLLAVVEDVEILANQLPHMVKKRLIDYKHFNHIDFTIAKDVKTLLYDELLMHMKDYIDEENASTPSKPTSTEKPKGKANIPQQSYFIIAAIFCIIKLL